MPLARPRASPSRAMLLRQSTTVPKTSNVSALTSLESIAFLSGQDRRAPTWCARPRTPGIEERPGLAGTRRARGAWGARPGSPITSITHDQAAVDVEGLARHVVRIGAGQEGHHRRHVLRLLRPAEGDGA